MHPVRVYLKKNVAQEQVKTQDQTSFSVTPVNLFTNHHEKPQLLCMLHGEWSEHRLLPVFVRTDLENVHKAPCIGLTHDRHSKRKHVLLLFLVEFSQGANNGNSAVIKIHTTSSSHPTDNGWRLARSCSFGYSILERLFQ